MIDTPPFSVVVQWSDEDDAYVALVRELPGVSGIASKAERAVKEALEGAAGVVELLQERGRQVPVADRLPHFSGQFRVRMTRTLHRRLALLAAQEGVSLNALTVQILAEGVGARRSIPGRGRPGAAVESTKMRKRKT